MEAQKASAAAQELAHELQRSLTIAEIEGTYFEFIESVIPADAVGLYLFDNTSFGPRARANADEEFLADYELHGRCDDPVLDFVMTYGLPTDSSRIREKRWRGSGARQVLGRAGLHQSMESPIGSAGRVVGSINFARQSRSVAFERETLSLAGAIGEQVSLAIERAVRHEAVMTRMTVLESALEQMQHGLVIADPAGSITWVSDVAVEPLSRRVTGGRTVREVLEELLVAFCAEHRRALTTTLRGPGSSRIILKCHRVPGRENVMVEVHDAGAPEKSGLPAWDVLSPREQEIATLVSQGLSTREIAEKAFVTQNTVKQHLKRIFAKTDVHNRAELIQLIWAARERDR